MSSHDSIIQVASTLGYSTSEISQMTQALNQGAAIRAAADRSKMVELPSPMAAAASDPKKGRLIAQICSQIKNATGFKYTLPPDRPVDEDALNVALRGAPVDLRMGIKENLFRCGLIKA